jgi:hypothetical protein
MTLSWEGRTATASMGLAAMTAFLEGVATIQSTGIAEQTFASAAQGRTLSQAAKAKSNKAKPFKANYNLEPHNSGLIFYLHDKTPRGEYRSRHKIRARALLLKAIFFVRKCIWYRQFSIANTQRLEIDIWYQLL